MSRRNSKDFGVLNEAIAEFNLKYRLRCFQVELRYRFVLHSMLFLRSVFSQSKTPRSLGVFFAL